MIEIEIENGLLELEKLLDASDAQIAQVIEKSKIFRKLEDLLDQADWRTADVVTLGIMLVACQRREAGWLDQTAIAELPYEMLHQIDLAGGLLAKAALVLIPSSKFIVKSWSDRPLRLAVK